MKELNFRALDWRTVGVLLVGATCLNLEGAIARGQISVASLRIPFEPASMTLAYGLLPLLCLPFLGHNPLSYFRLGRFRDTLPVFLLFLVIVLGSTLCLSLLGTWGSPRSSSLNWAWQMQTFPGILCGEFFFRGFLLLPLFARFGWYALPIAVIPYGLIHVGKPLLEAFGSIVFGLGLSYLAVRSGSILYGTLIHWLLNVVVAVGRTLPG